MQRYIVQPYDTLFSIAHKFGITHTQLLAVNPQINNLGMIFAGQITNIPNHTYTVRLGDTLNKIARQFRVPTNLLISANPKILQHNIITVGQMMSIPMLKMAPIGLEEIETAAENIIDAIDMQNWDEANSQLSIIKNNFNKLEPILQENSVSPSLIYNLSGAIVNLGEEIASKKEYESKVQANLITLLISYILDYYKAEIPTDIDKLDFLGREIILNVEKGDWDSVNDNLDYINVIWKDLEPRLSSEKKQDITEFSQIIGSLGQFIKNKDADQTIEKANDMLDKINTLERNF